MTNFWRKQRALKCRVDNGILDVKIFTSEQRHATTTLTIVWDVSATSNLDYLQNWSATGWFGKLRRVKKYCSVKALLCFLLNIRSRKFWTWIKRIQDEPMGQLSSQGSVVKQERLDPGQRPLTALKGKQDKAFFIFENFQGLILCIPMPQLGWSEWNN